ncbi:hypothetical protein H5410_024363 [Solanum commersonii]|uniref:Uncharacterized protein n=1 Tax=Solanum commersonii TaxID=4109 RepID=A0A9J5ZLS6_SOLCO|nr:hypothetical protein H5410_024363 [Solanum commersonii]
MTRIQYPISKYPESSPPNKAVSFLLYTYLLLLLHGKAAVSFQHCTVLRHERPNSPSSILLS